MIEKQIRSIIYYLKLLLVLKKLYLIFHIIKLTAISEDLIVRIENNKLYFSFLFSFIFIFLFGT